MGTVVPAAKKPSPFGSSTYPSVPVRDVKSPDVLLGTGVALMNPFVSLDNRTGMKHVRSDMQETSSASTVNSDGHV